MLKKNKSNYNNILSLNNIHLIQKEKKQYLFSSPYEKVIKILKSLKNYLLSYKNNIKAIEELDWVINTISKTLLYSFQKTLYHNENLIMLSGNHKIKELSNEIDLFNKEYEELSQKYLKITIKNEEYAKSLSYKEKNISFGNKKIGNKNKSSINPIRKIDSNDLIRKIKKSNKYFSQFSLQLLNDFNQVLLGNNSITDIYCTDNNGFESKKDIKDINFDKNKNTKELSSNSKDKKKNNNKKNFLYNNYQICSTVISNSKKNINKKRNISNIFDNESMKFFPDYNNLSNRNNNNQKNDKLFSLPLINIFFNGETKIDKYKINNFNKKNNLYINQHITHYDLNNNNKLLSFEKEPKKLDIPIPLNILNNIDINLIFDYENFDIFNLRDKIGLGNVLPFLGKEIIKKINIYHLLDELKLDNFLITISNNYQNTKALYHSSLHGVDVCYSTYIILNLLKNENNIIPNISELDIVSLIISALCHDVGHPGLNNNFLINSKNEISIIYNDISVLENFHCSKTFKLLQNNDINIFSKFSKENFLLIRKKMIGEILSTDLSLHFKIIDDFKEYKKNKDKKLEQNQLNFITHISDLSHNYRKFDISLKWVELLMNEFWNQGDKEKELGLPVSFLCDRDNVNVPKSQVGFINTFLINTIQELVEVNKNFEIMKKNALDNVKIWEKLEKQKRKTGWTPKK